MPHGIYIHGVTGPEPADHSPDYQAFRDGLRARGLELPSDQDSVDIEWGWNTPEAGDTKTLGQAEAKIAAVMKTAPDPEGFGLKQLIMTPIANSLRDLISLGFADVTYYVSDVGKSTVRSLVWNRLLDDIGPDNATELTIVAHSAGTLIAHDFLFWLYSAQRDDRLEAGTEPGLPSIDDMRAARVNWRVRRFVTLGSPLAPLTVRAPALADKIAAKDAPWLDAADLGVTGGALWLNVWDRHDVISYPLADLYAHNGRVLDLYPDHSDDVRHAHGAFWESDDVFDVLAQNWDV